MGFVFFEEGEYTNLSFVLSCTNLCQFDQHTKIKISKITGSNTESVILNSQVTKFNIDKAGFYRFECLYLIKNDNRNRISIGFDLKCKKNGKQIDIKNDLMYKGKVYPDSYSDSSNILDMNNNLKMLNDTYLDGVKMYNNDAISLEKLKNMFLNTSTYDFFNVSYWNEFYNRANVLKSNIKLLDNNCNPSIIDRKYREACAKLREVSDLKDKISIYRDGTEIDKLFEGYSFENPTFIFNKKIEQEFTGGNITDYITFEKKLNVDDRTQKTKEQNPIFNFVDNAERSIYVKQVI